MIGLIRQQLKSGNRKIQGLVVVYLDLFCPTASVKYFIKSIWFKTSNDLVIKEMFLLLRNLSSLRQSLAMLPRIGLNFYSPASTSQCAEATDVHGHAWIGKVSLYDLKSCIS